MTTSIQQSIELLCLELNQPRELVESFIFSLKVFTDKGMDIEHALDAHLKASTRALNNAVKISDAKEIKQMAVDWFYE